MAQYASTVGPSASWTLWPRRMGAERIRAEQSRGCWVGLNEIDGHELGQRLVHFDVELVGQFPEPSRFRCGGVLGEVPQDLLVQLAQRRRQCALSRYGRDDAEGFGQAVRGLVHWCSFCAFRRRSRTAARCRG
jgi:hypothetical protein